MPDGGMVGGPNAEEAMALAGALLAFVRANTDANRSAAQSRGYSPQQWAAVMDLARREGRTLSDLAAGLGLSLARVSRLVDELEAQHLVLREADPHDGRAVRLMLTPAGRAMGAAVYRERARAVAEALVDTRPDERETLARLLERLAQQFGRLAREGQGG
ncbi:MAG: MarR family winged helix-turn-helix transcriptional regulator [Chloroflexota bacterium]|nr:MarR family winged helix-turn-helix transcriptional regulator [Chloroflexota bacterium]